MRLFRTATIVSIGLSILGAMVDRNEDSSLTTVAEIAVLVNVMGGVDDAATPAHGRTPDSVPADLAHVLSP